MEVSYSGTGGGAGVTSSLPKHAVAVRPSAER
jgi:hypothetical protein